MGAVGGLGKGGYSAGRGELVPKHSRAEGSAFPAEEIISAKALGQEQAREQLHEGSNDKGPGLLRVKVVYSKSDGTQQSFWNSEEWGHLLPARERDS